MEMVIYFQRLIWFLFLWCYWFKQNCPFGMETKISLSVKRQWSIEPRFVQINSGSNNSTTSNSGSHSSCSSTSDTLIHD